MFSIWILFTEWYFLLLEIIFGARKILSSPCLTADASDNIQWVANAVVTPVPQTGGEKQENHNKRNVTNYSRYRQEDLALSLDSITSLQQRCPSPWIISPNLQALSAWHHFCGAWHKKSEFWPLKSSHTWQEQLAWFGEWKFLAFCHQKFHELSLQEVF